MSSLTFLHEAEVEMWEAVVYYEERASGLGMDFKKEVECAFERIHSSPQRCPLRDDGTRRFLLARFPYVVVYTVERGLVWILAIAHCKRKPGYWGSRG